MSLADLSKNEIGDVTDWLRGRVAPEPYEPTFDAVIGDIDVGKSVYAKN